MDNLGNVIWKYKGDFILFGRGGGMGLLDLMFDFV